MLNILERFVEWLVNIFTQEEESKKNPEPPRPDFDDMINWSKTEIDMDALAHDIHLDRRKTKVRMIEDYKTEYEKMIISKAQSEVVG